MLQRLRELGRMANGWIFTNATFLAARVELDPEAAARWLPGGVRLASPAVATIFVAHYPETTFGSVYREAGVFLHVRRRMRAAVHCPWMIVDDDIALILGRELLGYPKKIGEISLHIDGDAVEATAQRKGARLLRLRGTLGAADPSPPPMLAQRTYNVWGGVGLSLQRLIAFTPTEQILGARRADLSIEIGEAVNDPLDQLGVGRVLSAHLYRVNIGGGGFPWGTPRPVRRVSPGFMLRNWALRYQ